jgi:17beta-estradiol 17-dehydrogenase / very-long-chain 3-oxoacyl-CoA reductase
VTCLITIQVKSLLELNVTSTTWMTRIVLPGMVANKRGAIVNLSSAAARNPSPLLAEYSGVKSFIEVRLSGRFFLIYQSCYGRESMSE